MAKDEKLVKVKIGDAPVVSRTSPGGYPPNSVVEMPAWEAKPLVAQKLGSYTSSKKEPVASQPQVTTNAPGTAPAPANK